MLCVVGNSSELNSDFKAPPAYAALLFSAASPRQPSLYRFNQRRIVEPKGAGAERGHGNHPSPSTQSCSLGTRRVSALRTRRILSTVSTPTASMVISRRPHGCSYSITIRQEQRHILATADRGLSSRMRRTKPITLDICCAVLQRNDLFGLYISPMAPLFPPEFATASSISGIQIARAMTVISPSSYHHRWKCRLNMRIHCSLPVGLACRQARMSL